ncbi:MAG TPA: cytochrome c biogenesis protein ResB [Stackebrandtia sp.]|jgi:cytochrome c biogenesis protein|uniref:cytochrome c biogenesis protein ResB n=1 Tax=Stackebrandtia sp. TaxID=2023065 RepID=UPI002D4FBBEC|nr:cytochrome c biogenesis protein ResB [Stackebrandtia sp.]HZE38840.1 cytochrome c biogenesis protein ResB [Stackebrandtia sp.]
MSTTATPRRSVTSILRRWWRQLTSMRTALVLLLFLAIGAIPGSLLPQRNLSADKVSQYYADNPSLAPIVDRLWGFDVYSSPWFAAIYLLLFTSLVGCLVPRLRDHIRALRRQPPDAPSRMSLLPMHRELPSGLEAKKVADVLRRNRFRVAVREKPDDATTISAEKGFLRDSGNLLFHFSLLALLAAMAFGALYGWHGNRILVAGEDGEFCDSLQQYDEYGLGPNKDATDLPPFCLRLDHFTDDYLPSGQPTKYIASVRYGTDGAAPTTPYDLQVNHPLELSGASVFLLGHGYAPVITYQDRYGDKQTTVAPFLPDEGTQTSSGAAVFPDANINPKTHTADKDSEIAFQGMFIPAVPDQPPYTQSTSPLPKNPALMLTAYKGDTGLDSGQPHSVYSIDQKQVSSGALKVVDMKKKMLKLHQWSTLDDGTKVKFSGLREYATLEIRDDPGETFVLASAVLILLGLLPALLVRRRRVWVRLGDTGELGGLARTEYDGFGEEFDRLGEAIAATPTREPDKIGSD